MIEGKILKLVETKLQEAEWIDCFVVDIIQSGNKLEVFMDSDEGITFKKCRQISRYLEEILDEGLWLGEKYTLDVSSPGERPLKLKRQYLKNIGRTLSIKLAEKTEEGKLLAVEEEQIILEQKVRIKEGKKKRDEIIQTPISFADMKETKVKFTFK